MIYSGIGLSDLAEVVQRTIEGMRPHLDEFDSIAVRGMSGVLVGSPVSLALGKPLVVVRKPEDSTHASLRPVGSEDAGYRYVFLDDFVSLGVTRQAVRDAMERDTRARYVGSYLYESGRLNAGWSDTSFSTV